MSSLPLEHLHIQLSDINCVPNGLVGKYYLADAAMQQGEDFYLLFVKLDTICMSGGAIERGQQMSYST